MAAKTDTVSAGDRHLTDAEIVLTQGVYALLLGSLLGDELTPHFVGKLADKLENGGVLGGGRNRKDIEAALEQMILVFQRAHPSEVESNPQT